MPSIVISASRRTDIPAFYMPWFMACVQHGFFEVSNPYNRSVTHVPAHPEQVHSIVFWSKDFGPFLQNGYGEKLMQQGYRFFFNFTINSPQHQLEPRVPPLQQRLDQLACLCRRFGPERIHWRFDPICHYREASGRLGSNLDQFETIARFAATTGVKKCITSFVDLYRKVQRRLRAVSTLELYDPPLTEKVEQIIRMARLLAQFDIQLHLCCEKEVLHALPAGIDVRPAACIPVHDLKRLYGPGLSLRKDPGQRSAAGCGCGLSRDIGSYDRHPCRHNCLFCYANPISDGQHSTGDAD